MLACFPIVFIGELPDKTMFANLVMATRGRPHLVWLGAVTAFALHVAIAVTAGEVLVALAPKRVVEGVVSGVFLLGAGYAFRKARHEVGEDSGPAVSRHGAVLTAFVVVFLAEWGDLTQIIIANLAARYHEPVSVALGSFVALALVAGIATTLGRTLLRLISAATVHRLTGAVLVVLAGYSAWVAAR